MGKQTKKGFNRTRKQWEESISSHLGKFLDRLSLGDVLDLAGFTGLFLTYYLWEQDDRPPLEVLKYALPQSALDFMLLKSKTEVGVGAALTHLGTRGLIELLQNLPPSRIVAPSGMSIGLGIPQG